MTKQMTTMGAVAKDFSSEEKNEGDFPRIGASVARPVRLSAAQAASIAGRQLGELVRLPLDSISSVTRTETGWQVIINLVELSRIPHSTDVISSYNITLGEDGVLEGYRRVARYTRDQLGDDL
jgi:hypothetical protein